jgi:hypothetical protein
VVHRTARIGLWLTAGQRRRCLGLLRSVSGMAHVLAAEPEIEPASQTSYAATVDGHAVTWLQHHMALMSATGGAHGPGRARQSTATSTAPKRP